MWHDVGRDWRQATWPDLQASTMTANRLLRYDLSKSGPEEDLGKYKITPQILVQTHTKIHCGRIGFIPAVAQLSTVKH